MKYLEEEILSLLIKQKYRQIENAREAPFKIFYKDKEDAILMVAVIKQKTEQGLLKLEREFFDRLKEMMKSQATKPIIFSYWVILSEEPKEKERKLALDIDNIWFIDEEQKKVYVFDEVNPAFFALYKQLDAVLTGNFKALRRMQRGERKKEYEKNWKIIHERMTPANTTLVLINILIFIFIELSGQLGESLFMNGVMEWKSICQDGQFYRMITCMFLHFGFSHLFGNMLFLFLIGAYLERVVGTVRYLILYFGAGIGSSIVSLLYYQHQGANIISAGASGALFGVVGALLYIIIRKKGRLEELNWRSFLIMILGTISVGFFSDNVDNAAHVGGLIAGFLLSMICYRPRRRKRMDL